MQASKDITKQKVLNQHDITSCTKESGICELYGKFLADCNYKDACDAFRILKEEYLKNEELQKLIKQQNFVILDPPKSVLEVIFFKEIILCKEVRVYRNTISVIHYIQTI